MDQDTRNQLERHISLRAYLDETKPRWTVVPALQKLINRYFSRQGALPAPPPDADLGNDVTVGARRGTTQAKTSAHTELATLLPPTAATLHLWLIDTDHVPADETQAAHQRALAAQLDIRRPSSLRNGAAATLVGLAQVALEALVLVPAADLADYDLTAADTAAFEAAAATFGLRRGQPRVAQVTASTAAGVLNQTLDDLDHYVLSDLKKGIETRRVKDPGFVTGFKKAYTLIDRRGGRRGGAGSPAPAPPTPPPVG